MFNYLAVCQLLWLIGSAGVFAGSSEYYNRNSQENVVSTSGCNFPGNFFESSYNDDSSKQGLSGLPPQSASPCQTAGVVSITIPGSTAETTPAFCRCTVAPLTVNDAAVYCQANSGSTICVPLSAFLKDFPSCKIQINTCGVLLPVPAPKPPSSYA